MYTFHLDINMDISGGALEETSMLNSIDTPCHVLHGRRRPLQLSLSLLIPPCFLTKIDSFAHNMAFQLSNSSGLQIIHTMQSAMVDSTK